MPSTGLLPFLRILFWLLGDGLFVSMPSTGLLPFLRQLLGTLDFTGFRELFLQVIN